MTEVTFEREGMFDYMGNMKGMPTMLIPKPEQENTNTGSGSGGGGASEQGVTIRNICHHKSQFKLIPLHVENIVENALRSCHKINYTFCGEIM